MVGWSGGFEPRIQGMFKLKEEQKRWVNLELKVLYNINGEGVIRGGGGSCG